MCDLLGYAMVTCEIKLFQNYFTGLLQFMNILISNVFQGWLDIYR